MNTSLRNRLGALAVGVLALSAAYSADFAGLRTRWPPPSTRSAAPAAGRNAADVPDQSAQVGKRSQPWWQEVTSLDGSGAGSSEVFVIADHALQWRVTWTCAAGDISIAAQRPQGEAVGHPLSEGSRCPGPGTGYSVDTGEFRVAVETPGEWKVVVEQQLDVPLVEPPTSAMRKGEIIAEGSFYGIDRNGEGTFELYRLQDDSLRLRVESFYVTPNIDLEITLSEVRRPSSTEEFARASYERIALLPITSGAMNFEIPSDLDLSRWESIVIWCPPQHIAYAGATIETP